MDTLTKTIDLEEELRDAEERLEDFESEIEERVDSAMELDPPEDEDEREQLEYLENEVTELEAAKVLVTGRVEALQRALDEWEGSEVVVRELTGAEARQVRAEAQQRADKAGVEYTDDFHETLMLQKGVEQTPPGAPDPGNIGDLPERLFDLFVHKVNALNSVGDFEMGNSSLRERMVERKNSQSASKE
jgi:hypothetical protein